MSGIQSGLMLFSALMMLLVVRVPIGIGMFMVGAAGYVWFTGGEWMPLLNSLKNLAYARLSNYDLIVIPLFLLMGQFATHGGLSRSLFRFVSAFLGHLRGGIAMASVGACAASAPSAAPRWRPPPPWARWRCRSWSGRSYSGALATGALAAGGTLGIMIPPSVPLVIYADPDPGIDRQAVHGGDHPRRHRDARLHAGDPASSCAGSRKPGRPASACPGPSGCARCSSWCRCCWCSPW